VSGRNDHQPLVSVGLPVFNAEETLTGAVHSVLNQQLADLEVIVCDNASSDRTREVAMALAREDDRVRYFRHDHNIGAWRNFESTFELSNGVFFKWASDDDRLAPDLLAKAVRVMERDQRLTLCTWLERMVDSQGVERRRYTYEERWPVDGHDPKTRFKQFLFGSENGGGDPIYGVMRRETAARTRLLGAGLWIPNFIMLGELAVLGPWHTIPEILADRGFPSGPARGGSRLSVRSVIRHFDPSNGDILWPHWRFMAQHCSIVHRSAIPARDKLYLYAELTRHFGRRGRGMASDILDAIDVMRGKRRASEATT